MIRIYEVYIDIYFIENVMMDAQLLILVLLLLKEKILWRRLLASALTGGAGAVLILLSGVGFNMLYVFCVLLLDAVMLLICTYRTSGRVTARITFQRLAAGIIYLHGMVFAYGKLMACVDRLIGERLSRLIVTAAITGIVVFLAVCRNFAGQRRIYDVTLTENDENIAARALFDTGNLLRDPLSGKPVSVMEETEEIRQWLTKYPEKYRIIPYQSIGKEHGILEGIVVDELTIQKEQEQVVKRETIVALYKGKLSKDGAFQMILNHSLISV